MKRFVLFLLLLPLICEASPRELARFAPRDSFLLVVADFAALRGNDIYVDLEKQGKVWSAKEDSDLAGYFEKMKIDPSHDVVSFLFSNYLNPYGNKGTVRVFELNREAAIPATAGPGLKYSGSTLYRLDPEEDEFAVYLDKKVIAFGNLNEAKATVDLKNKKMEGISKNPDLAGLLQKIPAQAAIWGAGVVLDRQTAADTKANQSTNAVLGSFRNYYFYGVPAKSSGTAQFFGETSDEKQAAMADTFLVGMLFFAKAKAPKEISEMMDSIQINRNGKTIHVTGAVTKELVDAYYKGQLGVK